MAAFLYHGIVSLNVPYNTAAILSCRRNSGRYVQVLASKSDSRDAKQTFIGIAARNCNSADRFVVSIKLAAEQLGSAISNGHPSNVVHIQIRSQFKIYSCVGGHTTVHHFGNPREVFGSFNQIRVGFRARALRPLLRTTIPYVGLGKNCCWQNRHCHQKNVCNSFHNYLVLRFFNNSVTPLIVRLHKFAPASPIKPCATPSRSFPIVL